MMVRWVLLGVLITSCSAPPDVSESDAAAPTVEKAAVEAATRTREARGVLISREAYGDDWPYTVASGHLDCEPPGSNVVLRVGDTVYALNGRAMGNAARRGYRNARETITLRDANGYFTVGDVGAIIERGLALCR